jgi:hypothetical protein
MRTNLEPGEISLQKSEHDINHNLDRLSYSMDQLASKIEVPIMKIQSMKNNVKKVQEGPWGLICC